MAKSSAKSVSSPARPVNPPKRETKPAAAAPVKSTSSANTKPGAAKVDLTAKSKPAPKPAPNPNATSATKKVGAAKPASTAPNQAKLPSKNTSKSNVAPVAKSAPPKAASAAPATKATKVLPVPSVSKSSPKSTAPAPVVAAPVAAKSTSPAATPKVAAAAKSSAAKVVSKPNLNGFAKTQAKPVVTKAGKSAADATSKPVAVKGKVAAPSVQSVPSVPKTPIAPAATKPAKASGKASGKGSGKGSKTVVVEAVAVQAPAAAPVAAPVKKAAPKAVAIVAAKSPSPAAKYPPIHPDDEFIGIEKLTEPEFIAQQLDMLRHVLSVALGQAHMLRAEADQLAAEMEPGDVQFDDESGEGASASMEREKDLAMAAEKILAAEDIERAITRLHNNVYGACTSCSRPIPRMRLRALPQATLCIECKNGGLSRRS